MSRVTGSPKTGGGSRKGIPNQFTADIKAMILAALNGVGGREYLVEQAKANPVAFMGLVGKIVPRDTNVTVRRVAEMSDDELASQLAAARDALRDAEGVDRPSRSGTKETRH